MKLAFTTLLFISPVTVDLVTPSRFFARPQLLTRA
jgi:hypothetical protein